MTPFWQIILWLVALVCVAVALVLGPLWPRIVLDVLAVLALCWAQADQWKDDRRRHQRDREWEQRMKRVTR